MEPGTVSFQEKNENRKNAKKAWSKHDRKEGRHARKNYTKNGAFGQEKRSVYRRCVMGTMGVMDNGKDDSDNVSES